MDQKGRNQNSNKQKIPLWCSNKKEVITQFIYYTSTKNCFSHFLKRNFVVVDFLKCNKSVNHCCQDIKERIFFMSKWKCGFFMIVSSDAKSIVRETLLSIVKWVWLFIPFFLLGITFKIVQKSISEHEMLHMITKMGQSICTSEANQ